MPKIAWIVGVVFALIFGMVGSLAEETAYPLPKEMQRSLNCSVTVNGTDAPVIETAVNHNRIWTSRPMLSTTPVSWCQVDGPAQVKVCFVNTNIETAVIRPLSLGIMPDIQGDTIAFTLPQADSVTVEINGMQEKALHLFASFGDEVPPVAENALVFDAGIHDIGTVMLRSGSTVYLAPGAVVRGQFVGNQISNVKIIGSGIIDGSTFDRWDHTTVPIDLTDCTGVKISGITILDAAAWTLNLYRCEDVTIDGVKIIGARSNSDGITIQSSKHVRVSNCFVRGWDDNLVVKGYDGDASDISFSNCVLWTDLAQSCEIGYETRADQISNITFENITVLHANHKPVISIHNSDHALVNDIVFRNITVEDCQLGQGDGAEFLIDLTTTKSQWSKTKDRGNIRNVLIENVKVLEGKVPAVRIFAINKDHTIDNVTIRNLTLMGEKISAFDQLRYTFSPRKLGDRIVIEP